MTLTVSDPPEPGGGTKIPVGRTGASFDVAGTGGGSGGLAGVDRTSCCFALKISRRSTASAAVVEGFQRMSWELACAACRLEALWVVNAEATSTKPRRRTKL